MRKELWLTCLLVSIGLTACQETTDDEHLPRDYLPVNETIGNGTIPDFVEDANDTTIVDDISDSSTPSEPTAPENVTDGSPETEGTSTTTVTTTKANVSTESEAASESITESSTPSGKSHYVIMKSSTKAKYQLHNY
uniref:Putative secreted mucin n=1 Tax=Amblyomma cajennense TaxID=34607 RepID=A0A023FCM0_AMBCJ